MIGTIANPSKPSVRLTALADPTITKITNGIEKYHKFKKISFKKGSDSKFKF